jgi:8-oxo-dGTP diphosphatase
LTINRPKIGVALFLFDAYGRFLMMKRMGSHGEGAWSLVGGHLELGKTPEETAADETWEELGIVLDPKEIKRGPYTNDVFDGKDEGKHYVTLFMSTRLPSGQIPKNMEQEKCEELAWFDFDNLPTPLFLPVSNFEKQAVRPPF